MSRLCTICVRGGSKGVLGKNGRLLDGVPLVSHSVRQALDSGLFSHVAVSSDDATLLDLARDEGAIVVERPAGLAGDVSPKLPAIFHAVEQVEKLLQIEFSTLVDLDATSPLRLIADIAGAVSLLEANRLSSVFTASEARRSPYFNQVMKHSGETWGVVLEGESQIYRRQDAPKTFDMNASVYVWDRNEFFKNPKLFYQSTEMFEMPPERSLDIDSELDFQLVSFLISRRDGNKEVK